MKKIAFIFPGQGAHYLQMGKDFYDNFKSAKLVFEEAQDHLHMNVTDLIFNGPLDLLTQTHHSQIAIYVTSIAILKIVQELYALQPYVCAGLSLGEYSALTAADWLSFREGLSLVKHRSQFMSEACEKNPGTMAVVMGLNADQVEECVKNLSMPLEIGVANYNCPGQIVISGTVKGIEKASQALKELGAKRVLPLQVHGAFHSNLMQEAQVQLQPFILAASFSCKPAKIVMNVSGDFVESPEEAKQYLVKQVTHSVRWQQGIEAIEKQEIDAFIEFGPGQTLAGMNKRIGVEAPTFSIDKIAQLEQCAALI